MPPLLRALAREPAMRSGLVFGLIDATENSEHLHTTYNVSTADAPRLIALRKVSGYRQFAVSSQDAASDAVAMRGAQRLLLPPRPVAPRGLKRRFVLGAARLELDLPEGLFFPACGKSTRGGSRTHDLLRVKQTS